jgi:hypothetical protein
MDLSLNLIYKGILKEISKRILLIERNRLEKIVKENGLHDLGPIQFNEKKLQSLVS